MCYRWLTNFEICGNSSKIQTDFKTELIKWFLLPKFGFLVYWQNSFSGEWNICYNSDFTYKNPDSSEFLCGFFWKIPHSREFYATL